MALEKEGVEKKKKKKKEGVGFPAHQEGLLHQVGSG